MKSINLKLKTVMNEQEMINAAFEDLLQSLRKGTTEESKKMIRTAFEFAREAHQGAFSMRATVRFWSAWAFSSSSSVSMGV